MASDLVFSATIGAGTPVNDTDVTPKAWVEAAIATAVSGLGGGSGGGLYGAGIVPVTHSANGDLALDLDGGDRVFAVDLAANVTGLAVSNAPTGLTDLRIRFTNSTGSAKTIDFTGEAGIITELDFESVVSVAAGESVSSPIEYWND